MSIDPLGPPEMLHPRGVHRFGDTGDLLVQTCVKSTRMFSHHCYWSHPGVTWAQMIEPSGSVERECCASGPERL